MANRSSPFLTASFTEVVAGLAHYLITLSARASMFGGIVSPICFAVLRIDNELKLRRLLHGQIGRFCARVALLWDPRNLGSSEQWKAHQLPAKELGLQLHSMEIGSAEQLAYVFNEAVKARVAALTLTQNPIVTSARKQVVDLAAKQKLPAIYH